MAHPGQPVAQRVERRHVGGIGDHDRRARVGHDVRPLRRRRTRVERDEHDAGLGRGVVEQQVVDRVPRQDRGPCPGLEAETDQGGRGAVGGLGRRAPGTVRCPSRAHSPSGRVRAQCSSRSWRRPLISISFAVGPPTVGRGHRAARRGRTPRSARRARRLLSGASLGGCKGLRGAAARPARVSGDPGWRDRRSRHACSTYWSALRKRSDRGAWRSPARSSPPSACSSPRTGSPPAQRRLRAPPGGARHGHRMTLYPEAQDHAGGRDAACAEVEGELAYAPPPRQPTLPSPSTRAGDGGSDARCATRNRDAAALHGGHQRYPGFALGPRP